MGSSGCSYRAESGRIDCVTTGGTLKFVIQLWKQSESDDECCNDDCAQFILEVQRRRGCSIEMKNVRRGLFHMVLTGEMATPSKFGVGKKFPCQPKFLKMSTINFTTQAMPLSMKR